VKARFILDQFADQEKLGADQDEIAQYVTQIAYQQGVSPDVLARQLTSQGQLGAVVGDVLRSKAATLLAERVMVTDSSGRKVVIGDQAQDGEPADQSEPDASDSDSDAAEAPAPKGRAARRGIKAVVSKGEEKSGRGKGRGRGAAKDDDTASADAAADTE
jgi:hypothetical protein